MGSLRRTTIAAAALLTLAAISPAGADNWALEFDGENDYAIAHDFSMDYHELTVEAWTYTYASAHTGEVVGVPTGQASNVWFQLERRDDQMLFDPLTSACRLHASLSFPNRQWFHLAAVFDPPDVILYVDGEVVATRTCDEPPAEISLSDVIVGKEVPESSPHQYWHGLLDEIRIWTAARSQADIQTMMFQQLTGSEDGLYVYWTFDEGEGQIIHDLTASGFDGHLGYSGDPDPSDPVWVLLDAPVPVRPTAWSTIKAIYR